MQQALPFIVTGAIFLALDMAWFALFAGKFYKAQLGPMMRDRIGWPAAGLFYLIYIVVLTLLAIEPAHQASDAAAGAISAGLIGLAAYSAYNFTNIATLRGWPMALSAVDLIWGTVATALTGWLSVTALAALGA